MPTGQNFAFDGNKKAVGGVSFIEENLAQLERAERREPGEGLWTSVREEGAFFGLGLLGCSLGLIVVSFL